MLSLSKHPFVLSLSKHERLTAGSFTLRQAQVERFYLNNPAALTPSPFATLPKGSPNTGVLFGKAAPKL